MKVVSCMLNELVQASSAENAIFKIYERQSAAAIPHHLADQLLSEFKSLFVMSG